jgi:hypothetical protein
LNADLQINEPAFNSARRGAGRAARITLLVLMNPDQVVKHIRDWPELIVPARPA